MGNEDEKRAALVGRLVRIPALVIAAEKFFAVVTSYTVDDPEVTLQTAGLLIDIASQSAKRREADR